MRVEGTTKKQIEMKYVERDKENSKYGDQDGQSKGNSLFITEIVFAKSVE